MDDLPEELLVQIVSYLVPEFPLFTHLETATLDMLCRTLTKFYRVARPYLYACIHTVTGLIGRQLLHTLQENPHLVSGMQSFSATHQSSTCCSRTAEIIATPCLHAPLPHDLQSSAQPHSTQPLSSLVEPRQDTYMVESLISKFRTKPHPA